MVYIKQTIYVNTGFRKLRSLIGDFLVHLGFYSGDSHKDNFRLKRPTFQKEEFSNYITIYPLKSSYSIVASGIGIKIINNKKRIQEKNCNKEELEIPKTILTLSNGIPNQIVIDSHNLYGKDSFSFMLMLANWLVDNGIRVFIKSFSDDLFSISTNLNLSPEERLVKLDTYLNELKFFEEHKENKKMWNMFRISSQYFTDNSIKSLDTGFSLFKFLSEYKGTILDSSPLILPFTKSVEIEVEAKVLKPFKNFIIQKKLIRKIPSAEIKSHLLRKLVKYVKDDYHSPELGSLAYLLGKILSDKSVANLTFLSLFKKFIEKKLGQLNYVFSVPGLKDDLDYIVKEFRNKLAHKDIISQEKVYEILNFLRDDNGAFFLKLFGVKKIL